MVRLLIKNGWVLVRIRGSHHIMQRGEMEVSVPVHANRSLPKGTEHGILKKTGVRR